MMAQSQQSFVYVTLDVPKRYNSRMKSGKMEELGLCDVPPGTREYMWDTIFFFDLFAFIKIFLHSLRLIKPSLRGTKQPLHMLVKGPVISG